MTIDDYDDIIGLMTNTPGISLRGADSRESTKRYLLRNPSLSFVAECEGKVVGCVMSGHDGRRGYMQHLVVLPAYRNYGIGVGLVERCLQALEDVGILKTHIEVLRTNDEGMKFWERRGWQQRVDIHRYSLVRGSDQNV